MKSAYEIGETGARENDVGAGLAFLAQFAGVAPLCIAGKIGAKGCEIRNG